MQAANRRRSLYQQCRQNMNSRKNDKGCRGLKYLSIAFFVLEHKGDEEQCMACIFSTGALHLMAPRAVQAPPRADAQAAPRAALALPAVQGPGP